MYIYIYNYTNIYIYPFLVLKKPPEGCFNNKKKHAPFSSSQLHMATEDERPPSLGHRTITYTVGTPRPNNSQPFIYKWLVGNQLDDEPNLYIGNGWKSPFPSIYKWLALGFQVGVITSILPKKLLAIYRGDMHKSI